MRSLMKAVTVATAAVLISLPLFADAQSVRAGQRNGMYRPPGTNFWIYPQPRQEIRIGNTRIFPAQPRNYWPYGFNNYNYNYGYQWPYGYPQGYQWPYGNSYYGRIRRSR